MVDIDNFSPQSGRRIKEDNSVINESDILDSVMKVDTDDNYYIGSIEVVHQAVHERKMHTVSYADELVVNGGSLFVVIKATTKDIHARLAYNGEGKTRLRTYVGFTYTGGTPYIPFNRQTGAVGNIVGEILINPTITDFGTMRGNDFLGTGGARAQRVGGTGSSDIESIVNAGDELLVEILNLRGSASDLGFIGNMYEREPF